MACQLPLHAAIMNCLPTVSLRMLFPTCVQSLIFSDKDDDSFWGGKEEQGSSRVSDQEIPCAKTLCARSKAMVYEPGTTHLASDLNNPAQPAVETDSGICQVEHISGQLIADLSIFGSVFSQW